MASLAEGTLEDLDDIFTVITSDDVLSNGVWFLGFGSEYFSTSESVKILAGGKNLIYLNILDSTGYNIASQGGVMGVWKGSLVIKKDKNVINFYYLWGNTVSGSAYESHSRESKSSTIQHMCLQHTNEKDIRVLRSQHNGRFYLNGHYGFVTRSRVRFDTVVSGIECG